MSAGCSKECKEFVRQEIEKLRQDLQGQIDKLRTRLDALDDPDPEVGRVTRLDHKEKGTVPVLEGQVKDIAGLLNTVQRIVRNVTQPSETPGYERLELLGNMSKSSDLRDEVYRDSKYRLRICNKRCKPYRLQVNGVFWKVIPSEFSYVPVPRGPITVRKAGANQNVIGYDKKIEWTNDRMGFYIDYDIEKDKFVDHK